MKYRRLRIAWSVAWGVVAVLLCVLWVRSYWREDVFAHFGKNYVFTKVGARTGVVYGGYIVEQQRSPIGPDWRETNGIAYESLAVTNRDIPNWWFEWERNSKVVATPIWFVVMLFTICGTIPWLPRPSYRFSLRTLLIATTLVAVGMGLIVWAARS